MRLSDWLVKRNKTPSGFSRELGLAPTTLIRVINDDRSPTHEVMKLIITGTRGEVLPNDFFDIEGLLGRRVSRAKRRA